jgi:AraC family transcriptional regulator, regulatory protein of adaptative response / methylated-DNA-[protein]-cysteine methyltransferase
MPNNASFVDSRDFARVARAIRYIDANFRSQPRLAAIAAEVRLSEFHFNRLFRRWAGVTPRQYLAHVTAHAARDALASTSSVLDAAYAVGLSGPGRLHDLLVTLDAVTPGELKTGGRDLEVRFGFSDTPFGAALLAHTARGLSHLAFVDAGERAAALQRLAAGWPHARRVRDDEAAEELAQRIWDQASDAATARTPLKLAVPGTNFQLKVWQALLELGASGPTTYKALAEAVGMGGARAVGNAVGANPVAWLIPCHNVLRGDGSLGGYRFGPDRKRAMLAWESLHVARPALGRSANGSRASAAGLRQAT